MLSDQVSIARRFQRSIRLDSDVGNAEALQGFVCQRSAADCLASMASQISQTPQRAFTWTGPYGGGKSTKALPVIIDRLRSEGYTFVTVTRLIEDGRRYDRLNVKATPLMQ